MSWAVGHFEGWEGSLLKTVAGEKGLIHNLCLGLLHSTLLAQHQEAGGLYSLVTTLRWPNPTDFA